MTREEVFNEMRDMLSLVPVAFQNIPDPFLEHDWELWKTVITKETAIPAKWKNLISLGMAAAAKDDFGVAFWNEVARVNGVSDEEIKEVSYIARLILGFGPSMRINQVDMHQFKQETTQMANFEKSHGMMEKAA